jgi:hypothetical protein
VVFRSRCRSASLWACSAVAPAATADLMASEYTCTSQTGRRHDYLVRTVAVAHPAKPEHGRSSSTARYLVNGDLLKAVC